MIFVFFIAGYIVIASYFKTGGNPRDIFRSVVFFVVLVSVFVVFQWFVGFPAIRYTLMECFPLLALCIGLGAFLGFMHSLAGEIHKEGQWAVDWGKLIAWIAFLLGVSIITTMRDIETNQGLIRESTLLLMFALGNTITASFYRKVSVQYIQNL